VTRGGEDAVADHVLGPGAVFEVDEHPVGAGGRAHLGGGRRGHPDERAYGGVTVGQLAAQRAAVEGGGAHPNHRCALRACSYSARSAWTDSCPDTSAGATSHQTSPPGRSACGTVGTTMTTGPRVSRVSASAWRTSAAVVARIAVAPNPSAILRKSKSR